MGVSNVDTFNYKEYLTSEYGCTTTQEFLAVRSRVPLTPVFDEFNCRAHETPILCLRIHERICRQRYCLQP